jgi:paraquat-inducible protein B
MTANDKTPVNSPPEDESSDSSAGVGLSAPQVGRKPKRNLAWVWLIPIIAAGIGLSIVWRDWASKGPTIEITFQSADGIAQGKTQIKYRDVVVGLVTGIRLSANQDNVIVQAQLDKEAEALAVEGAEFWVVKPTIGVSGISGLSTLLSGSYIAVDRKAGEKTNTEKRSFIGLEQPPPISSDRPGTRFKLTSPTLGSIETGTPVYYLRIPVGVITDYKLSDDGSRIDLDVFVDEPYDKYVNGSTRFWNESGIQIGAGPDGLQISVGSIVSILSSGVSFATFGPERKLADNYVFPLFSSRQKAQALPQGPEVPIVMHFFQSTRGLEPGAPIDFHGVHIGVVNSVVLDMNPKTREFFSIVQATLYPAMLGTVYSHLPVKDRTPPKLAQAVEGAIKRGMRAQLREASLLTGGQYIHLVSRPDTPLNVELKGTAPVPVPTIPSETIEQMQAKIGRIIDSIEKIPFEKIGNELEQALSELSTLAESVDKSLTPELVQTMKQLQVTLNDVNAILKSSDAIPAQIEQSMQEIDRTIRATRLLVDELKENPNSIIFGEPSSSYSRDTLGAESP